jgi:hypothetical protein
VAAGALANHLWGPLSRTAAWGLVAATGTWLIGWVSQADWYAWPRGLETSFTGSGYCGDFSCMGQMGVTAPVLVSVAYVVTGLLAAKPPALRSWQSVALVTSLVAFPVTWFYLSGTTLNSRFEQHIYPRSAPGRPAPLSLWAFEAASPKFVALPTTEQRARAAAFYDETLSGVASANYFDAAGYRDAFILASSDARLSFTTPRYREIFSYGINTDTLPRRDIPRLTRHAFLFALLPTMVVTWGWTLTRKPRRASRDD